MDDETKECLRRVLNVLDRLANDHEETASAHHTNHNDAAWIAANASMMAYRASYTIVRTLMPDAYR